MSSRWFKVQSKDSLHPLLIAEYPPNLSEPTTASKSLSPYIWSTVPMGQGFRRKRTQRLKSITVFWSVRGKIQVSAGDPKEEESLQRSSKCQFSAGLSWYLFKYRVKQHYRVDKISFQKTSLHRLERSQTHSYPTNPVFWFRNKNFLPPHQFILAQLSLPTPKRSWGENREGGTLKVKQLLRWLE